MYFHRSAQFGPNGTADSITPHMINPGLGNFIHKRHCNASQACWADRANDETKQNPHVKFIGGRPRSMKSISHPPVSIESEPECKSVPQINGTMESKESPKSCLRLVFFLLGSSKGATKIRQRRSSSFRNCVLYGTPA